MSGWQARAGRDWQPSVTPGEPLRPGQGPIVLAGLMIGLLLMGVQLWLLTVSLELYLSGMTDRLWLLSLISGGIFAGGLLILWLLRRRPTVRHAAGGRR